jgi:hypothetical protein
MVAHMTEAIRKRYNACEMIINSLLMQHRVHAYSLVRRQEHQKAIYVEV